MRHKEFQGPVVNDLAPWSHVQSPGLTHTNIKNNGKKEVTWSKQHQ